MLRLMPGNPALPWLAPHKLGRNITAVAIALGLDLSVFLPENHHRDAGALQFARQGRPVRLDPPPLAGRNPGAPKELEFQSLLGDVVAQRPRQPCRRRPFQIVLDRAARHAQTPPDLAGAHPIVVKSQ